LLRDGFSIYYQEGTIPSIALLEIPVDRSGTFMLIPLGAQGTAEV
jgi:hypothetical protein